MANMGFIEYVGSIGGIAGVLAVLMFWALKNLIVQLRIDREYSEARLTKLIEQYDETIEKRSHAVIGNTQVLSELITWLKAKNGSKV